MTWKPIETAYGESQSERGVIIAVWSGTGWHVGEARLCLDDSDEWVWWWAGEGPGDYHAEPIFPQPVAWQPLPAPPEKWPIP